MNTVVESREQAEITADSFKGIDLQQQTEIASVLGKESLRGVTLEILREETLQLTDSIEELVEKGNNGDPEGYTQAGELIEQKTRIAEILYRNTVSTSDFATKIDDQRFDFRLPGPTSDQSQEDYIRDQLKDSPDEANGLINSFRGFGIDVSGAAPALSEAVLRIDSNEKTIVEQRELYEHGLADPKQSLNLVMEAVCQAREKAIDLTTINSESFKEKGERIYDAAIEAGLGEEVATMLKVVTGGGIRVEGVKKSRPIILRVVNDGRLYAFDSHKNALGYQWALGRMAS